MYNKGQTRVLFILINSIIDTTVIQLLVYHTATKDKPRTNNEKVAILISPSIYCIIRLVDLQ